LVYNYATALQDRGGFTSLLEDQSRLAMRSAEAKCQRLPDSQFAVQ